MSRRGILGNMRGNPDGSLSSRIGFAEALLALRYIDGLVLDKPLLAMLV